MTTQYKNPKPSFLFIGCLSLYFVVGMIMLLFFEKGQIEWQMNQYHQPAADIFFKYYTHVGDGWFYTAFAVSLLFVRYYYVLLATVSILVKTAIVQYMKLVLFHETPRPMEFFKIKGLPIHTVPGVEVYLFNSFPSGHTSTAFCMVVVALFIITEMQKSSNLVQFMLFFAAFLVGVSRIYLMQHFFEDTYAGTFIGVACAVAVIYLFQKFTSLSQHTFWRKSLLA